MEKKKTIYLKAYAHLNLGDDLFMDIIFKRYPDVQFYVECDSETFKSFFNQYSNVSAIIVNKNLLTRAIGFAKKRFLPGLWKQSFRKYYKSVFEKVDAIVVIGGSMFMQSTNKLDKDFDISVYRLKDEFFPEKPIFFLGGNFGPFTSAEYKAAYDDIFGKATDVCFREKYSYNLFSELSSVRVQPDIVFSYQMDFVPVQTPKSVGFSIVPAAKAKLNIQEDVYCEKYAEMINKFIEEDYTVKLFSFCEREGDEQTINNIISKLKNTDKVNKVFYNGDVDSFLKEYSSVESIFCGRFHALILSMVFNQKIIPMSYSKKMVNILEDIKYDNIIIDLSDFISYDLSEITTKPNKDYDVFEAKQNGILHFEKLDTYINNSK
jgi:colanic acid/amylovoran biosynthesis protein